jgi:hypothetical protein
MQWMGRHSVGSTLGHTKAGSSVNLHRGYATRSVITPSQPLPSPQAESLQFSGHVARKGYTIYFCKSGYFI